MSEMFKSSLVSKLGLQLIAALIIALIPVLGGHPASAQMVPASPTDLMIEFLGSSLGAAAGGFFGVSSAIILAELDPLGRVRECRQKCVQQCHCSHPPCFPLICPPCGLCKLAYMQYGAYATVIALPIGATVGVTLVGSAARVRGNVPLALLGGTIGELAGLYIVVPALGLEWNHLLTPAATVFLTGLGATLGYNIGAHMKDEGVGELDIPLFEVRW